MDKKIDINEIARLAGVSRSTVSRVLTGSKNVKRDTERKIREVMLYCDYKPSVMARGLATGRINIVALVVSDIRNPFYSELVWAISEVLREKGFFVSLYNCGHTGGLEDDYIRSLLEFGFAGLMIADARNDENFKNMLSEAKCPVVLLNRYIEGVSDYDAILTDNYLGGYLAAKHLIDLGHRNIGVLSGPKNSTSSMQRLDGFLHALRESGISPRDSAVIEGNLTMESGYSAALSLFSSPSKRVSALFAGNDMMAIGVMNYSRERGVRIPEDLSLVGYDDIPASGLALVGLTTVRQPYAQMGQLVAEKLLARIRGDDSEKQKITLVPKLIVRTSTARYRE